MNFKNLILEEKMCILRIGIFFATVKARDKEEDEMAFLRVSLFK